MREGVDERERRAEHELRALGGEDVNPCGSRVQPPPRLLDSCGQLQVGVVSQTGNHMDKLWAPGSGDEDKEDTGVCVA